jgi:hypothetical protein
MKSKFYIPPDPVICMYSVMNKPHLFACIMYYCGRKGYKYYIEEDNFGRMPRINIKIILDTKRQYTYFKKRFG